MTDHVPIPGQFTTAKSAHRKRGRTPEEAICPVCGLWASISTKSIAYSNIATSGQMHNHYADPRFDDSWCPGSRKTPEEARDFMVDQTIARIEQAQRAMKGDASEPD